MTPIIHVEILRQPTSVISSKELRKLAEQEILQIETIKPGTNITDFSTKLMSENVQVIQLCGDSDFDENMADLAVEFLDAEVVLKYHVYRLNAEGAQVECMEGSGEGGEDEPVANHWILPSSDFHGLWESLVYDTNVKENLLSYMETTMLFSECRVDMNIITWNRTVLLHGPPGTGKTSLCKALAHKLSIRMGHRYTHGQLVEINSHSLFSKYFSESGKLVVKMFDKIRELIEDEKALVCVLIDEVESLTRARESSMHGSEPSDLIRAVNSVLTQIDQMRKYPNVVILTTSNITGAIDAAFLDRADIRQYIGLPSCNAIYKIYQSCVEELIRVKLVLPSADPLVPLGLERIHLGQPEQSSVMRLLEISRMSEGLSGRTLRRVPFLAHGLFVKVRTTSLAAFLNAMEKAVVQVKKEI